jgi:hypothetical protein
MSATAFDEAPSRRSSRRFFVHLSPERAVLSHLLDQHPRRLTLHELAQEVGPGFREGVIQRAVDNLAAARFIQRHGAALIAAPAAVNLDQQPSATKF